MINQCVRYTLGVGEFSGHYEELFVLISTTGDCFVLFCFFLQTWRIFSCYFGAIFNWESKVSRGRFGFAPFSQPIRFKNWSRSRIGHQCFPALSAVCSFNCEFSFGDEDINLRSYWWLGLLWFCFLWTQLKTALTKDIFVTVSTSRAGLV